MQQKGLHLTDEELDDFVRNLLPETGLARVEEHLLVCGSCRERVEALDWFVASLRTLANEPPGDVVHATGDGPVRLQVRQQEDGTWRAELLGSEIESAGAFPTQEEALECVRRVFCEMFPEHVCNAGCVVGTRKTA